MLDVRWWRRANALIEAMADEDDLAIRRAAFDLQRSLVGNGGLTKESFAESQKAVKALFGDIVGMLRPWAGKADKVDGLIAAYKRYVGDPDDPEFREKLMHDREMLARAEAEAAAAAPEAEEARIDRLILEREGYYKRQRAGQPVR